MKKPLVPLVALFILPAVVYAERRPDRTLEALENALQKFESLRQNQTVDSDWEVLVNSPEEGFAAATGDRTTLLSAVCLPDANSYGAILLWRGEDSLGTDYDDFEDQPVTLNWRDPDSTQRTEWMHLSDDDGVFDSVSLLDRLKPQETDDFLDRLTGHAELNIIVAVTENGRTKQATFSLAGAPSAETVKACGKEQTSAGTTLYFPDYVDGGGWTIQMVLSNLDPSRNASAAVTAFDPQGREVSGLFGSGSRFDIPSLGSRLMRSPGTGDIRRGWIEVDADSSLIRGLLTYRNADSGVEVGVEPVELGDQFTLFVEESSDIGTGVAIFKREAAARIELRIRNKEGYDPVEGVFVRHGDFHQRAWTIQEWFTDRGVHTQFLKNFRGLLFLRTDDGSPFAPVGLRFGKRTGSLSAVPVFRGGNVSGGLPSD